MLSIIQKQILDGAMLGDGHIEKTRGINSSFRYLSSSKEHVEYVLGFFKNLLTDAGITTSLYFDSRTNKEYIRSFGRTRVDEDITEQRKRWYPSDIKHIPQDLKLTPLVCLIWYIGDGGICNGNRTQNIKLSTQCFLKEEQEQILLPQLAQFEATLMKAGLNKTGEQQYYIYIPHRKIKDFLLYIGECPFNDYQYKWKYQEYKNSLPQDHTSKEQLFCSEYKKGKTYYTIAKENDVDPNVVKYYLIKNNIYTPPTEEDLKNRNGVVCIDKKNNKIIQVYNSSADAAKALNMKTQAGISAVLNGRRKSAGGYFWKRISDLTEEEKNIIKNL